MTIETQNSEAYKEHIKEVLRKIIFDSKVTIPERFTERVAALFDTLVPKIQAALELARKMPGGTGTSEETIATSRLKELVANIRYNEYAAFVGSQKNAAGKPYQILRQYNFYATDGRARKVAEGIQKDSDSDVEDTFELGFSPAGAWEFFVQNKLKIGDEVRHKDFGSGKAGTEYDYGGKIVSIDGDGILHLDGSTHKRRAYVYRKV